MSEIREISPPDAQRLLEGGLATFVDIRDPGSFREARVPGAFSLNDGNLDEFTATADRQRPLVVYCYHGVSSLGGAAFFQDLGFQEVYSLRGGFETWRRSHPTESA